MDSPNWRVVVVRAWPERGGVTVMLLAAGPHSPTLTTLATVTSVDAACAALAAILGEVTAEPGRVHHE